MSKNILIFSPPARKGTRMPMVNAGMGEITGWLKEQGYSVDQKDLHSECWYQNRNRFLNDRVDLSVFTTDRVKDYLRGEEDERIVRETKKLAELLDIDSYDTILMSCPSDQGLCLGLPILKKYCDDKLTIIGGSLTLTNDLEVVRLPFIDYGVLGDGELPLLSILEHEFEGKDLQTSLGVVYEKEGDLQRGSPYQHPMDMKAKPFFSKEYLSKHAETTVAKKPIIPYQLGRGCTQDCSFCNYFENQKYQYKDVNKVVEELRALTEEHNSNIVYFTDSNLFNDPEYVQELAEKLIETDLDIRWGSMSIILPRQQEFFDKLAHSGCKTLLHGIESVSNSVLHRMRKAQTKKMVESTLKKERKAGIKPFGFFIVDYANETWDEYYESLDFIKNNRDICGAKSSKLSIFEDNRMPISKNPEEYNVEVHPPDYEDFIDASFAAPTTFEHQHVNRTDETRNLKARVFQKRAELYAFGRNLARNDPKTLFKTQVRKLYREPYTDYTWLFL